VSQRRPRLNPRVAVVLLVFAIGAYLVSAFVGGAGESSPQVTSTPAPPVSAEPAPTPTAVAVPSATTAETLATLATIPVKGRAPATGYDREGGFGNAWTDVDRNGCDTRNDVLARDLVATTLAGACRVMSGTLADPYTGATIAFVRGENTSARVQIDHVVALSNAWQSGAQQLTREQRVALANDPRNLLAVDGAANSSKGDGDAATWLPANRAYRCSYVSRQVVVKAAYALWVTPAEHDAIVRVLDSCPA
jgi:hypothetical protein